MGAARMKKSSEGAEAVWYSPVPDVSFIGIKKYVPVLPGVDTKTAGESPYYAPKDEKDTFRLRAAAWAASAKARYVNMSLKTAFFLYVVFFMVLALVASFVVLAVFAGIRYSAGSLAVSVILDLLSFLIIAILLIGGILMTGVLFFRHRLEPPMRLLDDASKKIGERDLDFSLSYQREDEMGRLCGSFERMREALEYSNAEIWRQMEERRRLNSAFSHDLRTPLTVLKGNAHMLREYLAMENADMDKVNNTVRTMENHIGRMENYVDIMSRLQKLDDIEVKRITVNSRELAALLRNTALILCEEHILNFYDEIAEPMLHIDPEILIPVVENLISNAARYAKSRIAVVCSYQKGELSISVSDDGKGFSEKDLQYATNPFYKANTNYFDAHFGLGLNISKTLSERHGGGLSIANVTAGGALVRAVFSE